VADNREFPDPAPDLSVEEVRALLADFLPELHNAEVKEVDKDEKHYIHFIKKVGIKGRINPEDIQDEKCTCGHLRSEHNDRFEQGHGSCKKCDCRKFTWDSWVMKDTEN
jgi:PRTRC genetic system protein C